MPGQVREAVSEALKHLTASSQKNRNSLVSLQVLPLLIAQLQTGQLPASLHSTIGQTVPSMQLLPCPASMQS